MGIKERRGREKQELRQAILDTAREIAASEGWQAVTIRKIADEIEYSPPTIYEHFENKEAILYELLRVGFTELAATMRATCDGVRAADERLVQMARAYCAFAWRAPELYQVMHGLAGVPFRVENKPPEIKEGYLMLMDGLQAFEQAHGVQLLDREGAVEILWATAHGIVSLTLTERLAGGEATAMRLTERATRALLAAWRTGL